MASDVGQHSTEETVTDTRNTPDEPDGSGSVSIGEQARQSMPAAGFRATSDELGNGSGDPAARRPEPATPENGSGDVPDGAAPLPAAPGEVPVAAVPDNPVAAPPPAEPGTRDLFATAELSPDAAVPGPTVRPSPSPRPSPFTTGDDVVVPPAPAPGPVPTPGPGAAAPPPWLRMPSGASPGSTEGSEQTPADLLDDVPTAFVEPAGSADRPAGPSGAEPRASWSAPSERTGWTSSLRTRVRPPRRAALQLKRLDPWSVLKLALVLSGVIFLIFLVAVGLLYGVLDGIGVWDRLNGTYSDLVSGEGAGGGQTLISAWRVLGTAALFGAINSVLFAVALTVGAFVYNVSADLVGGIEVTLSERD